MRMRREIRGSKFILSWLRRTETDGPDMSANIWITTHIHRELALNTNKPHLSLKSKWGAIRMYWYTTNYSSSSRERQKHSPCGWDGECDWTARGMFSISSLDCQLFWLWHQFLFSGGGEAQHEEELLSRLITPSPIVTNIKLPSTLAPTGSKLMHIMLCCSGPTLGEKVEISFSGSGWSYYGGGSIPFYRGCTLLTIDCSSNINI